MKMKTLSVLMLATFELCYLAPANGQPLFDNLQHELKGMKKNIEGENRKIPGSSNENKNSTPEFSSSNYCKQLQSDPMIQRYVDVMEKTGLPFALDTRDQLLYKWVFDKLSATKWENLNPLYAAINECAFSLRDTKYFMAFYAQVTGNERYFRGAFKRNESIKIERHLDASGNMVDDKNVTPDNKNSQYWNDGSNWVIKPINTASRDNRNRNGSYAPVAAMALLFGDEGARALKNIAPQVIDVKEKYNIVDHVKNR